MLQSLLQINESSDQVLYNTDGSFFFRNEKMYVINISRPVGRDIGDDNN